MPTAPSLRSESADACAGAGPSLTIKGIYMKFDSLIFDIDGTLWDSTGTIARAWSDASGRFMFGRKHFTKQQVMNEVGRPLDVIFRDLYPEIGELEKTDADRAAAVLREINEISTEFEYDYLRRYGAELYPGVTDTLKALASEIPLFIVSNCEKGYIEIMTEASGLTPLFKDWLCFGDTLLEKDRTMQVLIGRHHLQKTAYVGDILNDALSSEKANVPFIWASYGFGEVDPAHYSERIDCFADLMKLV